MIHNIVLTLLKSQTLTFLTNPQRWTAFMEHLSLANTFTNITHKHICPAADVQTPHTLTLQLNLPQLREQERDCSWLGMLSLSYSPAEANDLTTICWQFCVLPCTHQTELSAICRAVIAHNLKCHLNFFVYTAGQCLAEYC